MWAPAKIPSDEMQDFWRGCRDLGFDDGSFMLSSREEVPMAVGPVKRIVTVQRKQIARDFEASSGHDWVRPALAALKQGLFGR